MTASLGVYIVNILRDCHYFTKCTFIYGFILHSRKVNATKTLHGGSSSLLFKDMHCFMFSPGNAFLLSFKIFFPTKT